MNNSKWILARAPVDGWPTEGDFGWREDVAEEPAAGQCLTRTIYLSLDPYQWGRRRRGEEKPGEVCHGRTVSQVVKSRDPNFPEGSYVFNTNGWQQYGLVGPGVSVFGYMYPRLLDPADAPISTAVGVLGMLGLTAYSGLIVQCNPQASETVVVSAASGGVGQVVGQLARIRGCKVIGIAGRDEKCRYVVDELGFDACISRYDEDFADQLAAACPDGVDVYFENVGGAVFEAVLPLLNQHSRISRCGLISQYGNADGVDSAEQWQEIGQPYFDRANSQVYSLRVRDYVAEHQDHFFEQMADWIRSGQVTYREDRWSGLEQAPKAFDAMLSGANFGKTLVQVSEDQTRASDGA